MVHIIRFAALIVFAQVFVGCTSVRESFPNHTAEQVWTAMIAVARTPDYVSGDYTQRWTVRENQVWVDDASARIEIFRRLERDLHRPASNPLHEERQWKFQAVLEKQEPPTVRFTSRQLGVPSHAWDEADRYFNEVSEVLSGTPNESTPAKAADPAANGTEPASRDSHELFNTDLERQVFGTSLELPF